MNVYILDLIRPTPRNPNFTGASDVMCVLRPELIAGYHSPPSFLLSYRFPSIPFFLFAYHLFRYAEYLRLKILTSSESKQANGTEEAEKSEAVGMWEVRGEWEQAG